MTLREIQNFIADRINSDGELSSAGVKAFAEDRGDRFKDVNQTIGRLGIVAIVAMPKWTARSSAAKGAVGTGTVQVDVGEVVATNRAKAGHMHGFDVAERISYLLNMESPGPGASVLVAQSITPGVNEDGSGVVYSIPFNFEHHLKAPTVQSQ